MKIILLRDVAKVGKRYEVKEVSSGHAQNMLIPLGHAIAATPEAIKRSQALRMKAEGEKKIHDDLMLKNLKDLEGTTLTITGKANDKGHLFAGIHKDQIIAELLKQTGLQISADMIQLEHPIKEIGEHSIQVKGDGKSATFKLIIE